MRSTRLKFLQSGMAAAAAPALAAPALAAHPVPAAAQSAPPTASSDSGGMYRILVLSGGTAYGAYEAGVLAGLQKALGGAQTYDIVCGTSAGALNGAMFASNQVPELETLWKSVSTLPVLVVKRRFADILKSSAGVGTRGWELVSLLLGATVGNVQGVHESAPVTRILTNHLVRNNAVVTFSRPLFWTATDVTDGCAGMFVRDAGADAGVPGSALSRAAARAMGPTNRTSSDLLESSTSGVRFTPVNDTATFIETLRASSAIPAVFDPALINIGGYERLLVDGGVLNNTPLSLVREAVRTGPVTVDVVRLGGDFSGQPNESSRNVLQIILGLYGAISQRLLDDGVRLLAAHDALSRTSRFFAGNPAAVGPLAAAQTSALAAVRTRNAAAYLEHDVTINVIKPSQPLIGSSLDFTDKGSIDWNFELGRHDVMTFGFKEYQTPGNICALG
jgi:predicted acylesterase/phospholipase RssA